VVKADRNPASVTPLELVQAQDKEKAVEWKVSVASKEEQQSRAFFYGYVIAGLTFLIAAAVEGLIFTFGVFFKPLLAEFGWTRAMTSGAFSLFAIVQIPIFIIAGGLTDRFGSRQVLTACGFFMGLGYLLMSQTGALWQLYFFYGLVAIGVGLYWIPVVAMVPHWFVKRRSLMMGIIASGIGMGQLIYPPLANWLISNYSWRMSFVVVGGGSMGLIMLVAQFLKRNPQQIGQFPYGGSGAERANPVENSRIYSLGEAVRTRGFWLLGPVYFGWLYNLGTVLVHSVIHAIDIGMSPASAANILAIIGVTGIIGRIVFGRLADVMGMKPVLIFSFFLMSAGFLWLTFAGEAWRVYSFAVIFGLSYGVFESLQSPILADLFGLSSLGTIMGVVHAFGSIGLMLGPVVGGYIFDVSGSYQVASLINATVALVSLICVVFLPITRERQRWEK